MRKLTETEMDICNKQIKRLENEAKELEDVKEYARRKFEKLKRDWEFEDFAKPLERRQTKINSEKTINQADSDIKEIKMKIKQLKDQMENGVKAPSGV